MIHLREGLIRALVARRHRVLCVCPEPTDAEAQAIARLGADTAAWTPRTAGLDVLAHRRSIDDLARVLAAHRPYTVLGYGLLPMLFASLAGRRVGAARVIPLVTSLSDLPQQDAEIGWSFRWLARSALRGTSAVVAHNEQDIRRLVDLRLLPEKIPTTVIPGGGVDLSRFRLSALPPLDRGLVFTMVARLDRAKGVLEFCEAAKRIKSRSDQVRFVLVGPPGNVTAGEIAAASCGAVDLVGELADIRPTLQATHVLVLPSYVEGMPRVVLEALATGRPIITTDISGARETIDERVNGVLVPPGHVDALVEAMESFRRRPDLIPSMARASRLKAERRFDAAAVNATLLQLLVPAAVGGCVA